MKTHTLQKDERNGNYFARITQNGVRRLFNLGRNKRIAEKNLHKLERDIDTGVLDISVTPTTQSINTDGKLDMRLEELIVEHLKWVEDNRSHESFLNRKRYSLKFLKFTGPRMTSKIRRIDLVKFFSEQKKKSPRKNNPGTAAMIHVKALLNWGLKNELVDLSFRSFPEIECSPPPPKRISHSDIQLLLAHADADFKDIIVFTLLTGLRPKEARQLTQSQIQYSDAGLPFIRIETHKTSKKTTAAKVRSVPLSPVAEEIVERQVKKHPQADNIFVNAKGGEYTDEVLTRKFARLKRRAGIKNKVTMYALRHTFASIESDSGKVESTALANLMGHSNTHTLKKYVHNSSKHHHDAVKLVEDSLSDILNQDEKQTKKSHK